DVALFLKEHNLRVEQVQEFTPTPGSLATCIYHTGRDPFSGELIHVPLNPNERRQQKALLLWHLPESRKDVLDALRKCDREDLITTLLGHQKQAPKQAAPTRKRPKRTRKR
ncbi:MAG TPA: DUF3362 domain-containing protein, partial [Desulfuromonadales bacterium]|nr:DUF3362 domain-containing protein [Desulfuromonadales bacterium]